MKKIEVRELFYVAISALMLFTLLSCEVQNVDDMAELQITFHDTLMDGDSVTRIDMTILETQIIDVEDNRRVISSEPQSFNLLEITKNNPVVLAHTSISPGTYKQIRLILDPNSTITLADGTVQPLRVPSGEQTGIKIDGVFNIPAGRLYTLDIDLDPGRSVHYTKGEGYMLKPVIELTGSDINSGNFYYAGSYGSDSFVAGLRTDGTLVAKTSRYSKYEIDGVYVHDGVNRTLTIIPTKVRCPGCSYWDKLKMDMFADVPPESSYDVVTFGADYLDLQDDAGKYYYVYRVPSFKLGNPPESKDFSVEVHIPDSAWAGKTLLTQVAPKGGGKVYTELAPIPEGLKLIFNYSIPKSEFEGPEKEYLFFMAIVEGQSDVVLRSDGTVATLSNVIAQNSMHVHELRLSRDTVATKPAISTFAASN